MITIGHSVHYLDKEFGKRVKEAYNNGYIFYREIVSNFGTNMIKEFIGIVDKDCGLHYTKTLKCDINSAASADFSITLELYQEDEFYRKFWGELLK